MYLYNFHNFSMMKQQKLVGTPQNTKEWKLEKKTKHKIPYFGPTFVYVKITEFSSFVFVFILFIH